MRNPLKLTKGFDCPSLDDVAAACDDEERERARRRPGPGRRTFLVMVAEFEQHRTSRHGLTVERLIRDELADAQDLDAQDDDLAIWEGNKLRGVVLMRGGPPRVVIFEEAEGSD
jgi:hypothetical protein